MDRAFICETCGKAFRFRSNLAEHRSVHTAVKPYVCKFCGKSSRLKGNLTKHILKHHKKEQNESIAKDDIIVKKTQKPTQFKENGPSTANGTTTSTSTATTTAITTTTAATVISNNGHNNNNTNGVTNHNLRTIKMEIEDPDYVNHTPTKVPTSSTIVAKVVASTPTAPRTRQQPREPAVITTVTPTVVIASPESPELCFLPKDASTESDRSVLISLGFDYGSTLSLTSAQLRQVARDLKAEMSSSPESGSHLPVHMTMNHGYPPPSAAPALKEDKSNEEVAPEALKYIDSRVSNLEKSLETALNSIYTLVQLQSGMTSSVNRLREDSLKSFNDLKERIDFTISSRRSRRRELSVRSFSDSRDRSRSPL